MSRPPNKDRPFKLKKLLSRHTPTESITALLGLSFLPRRSIKARAVTVSLFFFFSFLMEKEEPKMKSIFNVYRGSRLKSLQSAETILHKLIFNEKPLCVMVKQSEMLVLVKEKQTWSPLKRLKGCRTASLWAGVPAFTFKAAQCGVHC